LCAAGLFPLAASAADIVRDGQPLGAVWHDGSEKVAAEELSQFIGRMSGAAPPVRVIAEGQTPGDGEPAIVLGAPALKLGLTPPPVTPSRDGYALQSKGPRLLMAGESSASTRFAVTHLLEALGCRWYMANKWGEVIPLRKSVSLDGFDVSEKPDFLSRNVWAFGGPRWRMGGMDLPNRHDWQHVPAAKHFAEHPEYFALRNGERRAGGWVCTTNPDVIRLFADAYVAKAKQGAAADTISPPDGRGYCQCDACRAIDVPDYIEPSSGAVCMSDRYVTFFDAVGRIVAREATGFLLSFYAYADYTMPPKRIRRTSDNLCAWISTIRFCRLHGVDNPDCESRVRYRGVVEGWAALMRTACYDYNYNLAEVTVPISKISYVRANIPFLKKTGCIGVNMEAMFAWNLYGPHTYLTTKLLWKADADAEAILEDYYRDLFGPAAAPVKSYWERLDKACRESRNHSGSFFGIHGIWTPELIAASEVDLDAAARAAPDDLTRGRVALFRSGLDSARDYLALREALNRSDYVRAQAVYDGWIKRMDDAFAAEYNTMRGYKRGYADRYFPGLLREGLARTTGERRLIAQLPDEWDFRYDPADEGEKGGWTAPDAPAAGWRRVRTWSATLNEQGIGEQLTWMWYRTRFTPPAELPAGPLHLWFTEVDGSPTRVYLNGELVGEFTGSRRPADIDVTGKLKPGVENHVVLKTGHMNISELMLGGILRPVILYSGAKPEPPAKK
jgi:hypothetical protein